MKQLRVKVRTKAFAWTSLTYMRTSFEIRYDYLPVYLSYMRDVDSSTGKNDGHRQSFDGGNNISCAVNSTLLHALF